MEDEEFYGLDIVDKFDDEVMAKHVYNDPVQLAVRIILCRSLTKVFTTFRYEEDPNMKDFAARFPFHHEQMLVPIIDIVNDEFNRYVIHMTRRLDEIAEEGDKDACTPSSKFTNEHAKECPGCHNNGEPCQTSSAMYGHVPCKEKLEQSWSKCW